MEQELLAECRNIGAITADPVALQRLGRRVSKAVAAGAFAGARTRIAALSPFLAVMLVDVLPVAFLAHGIAAGIVKALYGATAVDLLSERTITNSRDLVLLMPTHRDLAFVPPHRWYLDAVLKERR